VKDPAEGFDYYEALSKNIFEKPDLLAKSTEMTIFFYYLTSVTGKELFSFVKAFFLKYDDDKIFMLNFDQFRRMMDSMARRFSTDTMNKYFLYLDKFNYHQCIQKDKLFSKNSDKDAYFGPFVMQCIFEKFKGNLPTQLDSSIEYLTDFWVGSAE